MESSNKTLWVVWKCLATNLTSVLVRWAILHYSVARLQSLDDAGIVGRLSAFDLLRHRSPFQGIRRSLAATLERGTRNVLASINCSGNPKMLTHKKGMVGEGEYIAWCCYYTCKGTSSYISLYHTKQDVDMQPIGCTMHGDSLGATGHKVFFRHSETRVEFNSCRNIEMYIRRRE